MEFFIDIVADHARHEVAVSGSVTVGAGPEADVVLPSADLSAGATTLEPRPEGCAVHPGAGAAIEVEGMRFEGGVLPWGTELAVGGVRLQLRAHAKPAARRGSPVLLLAPMALGIAAWLVLDDAEARPLPVAPAPPVLVAEASARCQADRAPARHRAERDERAAEAKRERYPFAPADGVEALALYQHAAACFADAGALEEARRATEHARAMRARLTLDYETARFRLHRALEQQQWRRAREEARELRELLGDRPGDAYTAWLALLDRRLSMQAQAP